MSITQSLLSNNVMTARPARLSSILALLSYLLSSLLLVFNLCYSTVAFGQLPKKTIGISQIVEHPALNDIRLGLMETLKAHGYDASKNLNILYENAQGNMGYALQIATKLLSVTPDVIIGISTPSAQTVYHAAKRAHHTIPIVFAGVSDPQIAQLEPVETHYPITGVSDAPHLDGLMELMDNLFPKLKTLGLLYNPSETNSVSTVLRLKKLLAQRGIQWHEATVLSTNDVAQATLSLVGKVDALYFPQDNTIVAAMETVIKVSQQASPTLSVILPIFCNDPILIKKGVLAAVGYDYLDIGRETGEIVVKILAGESVNTLPIHTPKNLKAVINRALAQKLGIIIPTQLKHATLTVMDS